MHMVHLTSSTFFGGPERQILELARALPADYRTTVMSFSEGGRCRTFLNEAGRSGLAAIELKHDFPRLMSAGSELKARLQDIEADVLCCHGYKADVVGLLAGRRAGLPVVAVSRGWTGENWRVRWYEAIDRAVLPWMDRVVCVSGAQAAKVRRAGVPPERIVVIANAIRAERFAAAEPAARGELERLLATPCRRIVLAAGRLSPEKGFGVLVEAARRSDPAVGFVLFGAGALREALQQQIDRAGLRSRFVLAGFRGDMDRLLSAADLMVLPSFTEGMPNVVLEALAAGVPVVATAVGGTPEVMDEDCGLLAPPGDAGALAAAMGDILANDDRRREMGRHGRERVQREFTFAAQAERYVELFEASRGASAPGLRKGEQEAGAHPARAVFVTKPAGVIGCTLTDSRLPARRLGHRNE